MELRDQLSIFRNLTSPSAWTGHFRGSPSELTASDGEAVVNAILAAKEKPVVRPVDPAKLARRPPLLHTKMGPIPAPEPETTSGDQLETSKEASLHAETQWLLLKLGNDIGLDVWVAQNDRNREVNGHRFSDLPRLKRELPLQFDEFTNRIIKLIDVLWLRGNTIVAAFEIECTTSIYSGLLRMSDLITMQPNLNIPLYIVAPNERQEKVRNEMNRPTFLRLSPPMPRMCRFISISALRERITQIEPVVRFLKPEFLGELSVSCAMEDP